jgi:hypothetical protein
VRAVYVFCGLEKSDYLALDNISLWGVTNVDICCFRGVSALPVATHGCENARFMTINLNALGRFVAFELPLGPAEGAHIVPHPKPIAVLRAPLGALL